MSGRRSIQIVRPRHEEPRRADHRRPRAGREPPVISAHERARERGVSRPLYALARALLTPPLRLWFRIRVTGAEHVPDGAAVLAPNHKSFLDPFFLGLVLHRPLRYMAKAEVLRGPLGRLLIALGGFPVRRHEADAEAVQTARTLLAQGGSSSCSPRAHVSTSPTRSARRTTAPGGSRSRPVRRSSRSRSAAPRTCGSARSPDRALSGSRSCPRSASPTCPRPAMRSRSSSTARSGPRSSTSTGAWPPRRADRPALAALGLGGGLIARRVAAAERTPRLLGFVEPRRLRRRGRLARLRKRLQR